MHQGGNARLSDRTLRRADAKARHGDGYDSSMILRLGCLSGGKLVPKGSMVLISPLIVHHNCKVMRPAENAL